MLSSASGGYLMYKTKYIRSYKIKCIQILVLYLPYFHFTFLLSGFVCNDLIQHKTKTYKSKG